MGGKCGEKTRLSIEKRCSDACGEPKICEADECVAWDDGHISSWVSPSCINQLAHISLVSGATAATPPRTRLPPSLVNHTAHCRRRSQALLGRRNAPTKW